VAFLAGVLLAGWSPSPWAWGEVIACLATAIVGAMAWHWQRATGSGDWPRRALAALAWGVAGAGWTAMSALFVLRGQLPVAWEGRELAVRGQVVTLPEVQARRSRFLLQVDATDDQPAALRGRVLQLAWYDDFAATNPGPRRALRAGATWQLWVRLRAPRGLRNPGGADAERHAVALRLAAVGQVRQPAFAREVMSARGLAAWRERMSGRIAVAVPGEGGRQLRALALGDTRGLEDADWRLLRAVGLTHLIAISGFHVGLVALAAAWGVQAMWRQAAWLSRLCPRGQAAALGAVLAAVAYAYAAGNSLPTVRTVLMIAVVALARSTRRPTTVSRSLALALMAVLLVDPLATLLAGFWLSFGGVACLAVLAPQPGGRTRWVQDFLRAQWVATLCLLPVGVAWFAQASWLGPLVNLLAIPWWSLVVVPLALLGLAAEVFHEGAGVPIWQLAGGCFAPSWRLFAWVAQAPYAQGWLAHGGAGVAALALLGAAWSLLPRGTPGKPLAAVLWLALAWPDTRRPGEGAVEITVLDVGQGLSVLVRTRQHALLYDAGPRVEDGFDAGERVVVPALRALGVGALDTLVVSHGDNDHAGGVAAVLAEMPVARRMGPPGLPSAQAGAACQRGDSWRWDGVRFRVLHPPAGFPYLGNESSCVLRIETGQGAALLTGDIGRVIEQRLLTSGPQDVRVEAVVAPHHGSGGSSGPHFVAATGARVAVFSRGHGNRFGHPHPRVLRTWARSGAELLDTARSGAVRLWLDETRLAVREQRRWASRWWDAEERLRVAAILSASQNTAERAGGSERVGTGQGRRLADGAPAAAGDPGAGDRAGTPVDAPSQ